MLIQMGDGKIVKLEIVLRYLEYNCVLLLQPKGTAEVSGLPTTCL